MLRNIHLTLAGLSAALLLAGTNAASAQQAPTEAPAPTSAAQPAAQPAAPPAVEAAPIAVALRCEPREIIATESPNLLKRAGMAQQGLITKHNMLKENAKLADKLRPALKAMDYDAACLGDSVRAANELAEAEGAGVGGETLIAGAVLESWSEKCATGDFDRTTACINDVGALARDEVIAQQGIVKILGSMPLEKADFDEAQIEALLHTIKAQVDAGGLSTSIQGLLVEDLLK